MLNQKCVLFVINAASRTVECTWYPFWTLLALGISIFHWRVAGSATQNVGDSSKLIVYGQDGITRAPFFEWALTYTACAGTLGPNEFGPKITRHNITLGYGWVVVAFPRCNLSDSQR